MSEPNEVLEAVDNINCEIASALPDKDIDPDLSLYLEYTSTGHSEAVTIMGGLCLWSSEGEAMPYNAEGTERLPFQPYLRQLLMNYLEHMMRVKVALSPRYDAVDYDDDIK